MSEAAQTITPESAAPVEAVPAVAEITPADAPVEAAPSDSPWYSGLPDTVQAWDEVKNSPDADSFYKQMGDMRSMIGRSLQIPGEDASAEAREKYLNKVLERTPEVMLKPSDDNKDAFYDSMGRPESADAYTVPEASEAAPYDNDSVSAFKPIAHEAGLNQAQFEAIVQKMSQSQAERNGQMAAEHQEQMKTLQGEWGLAFEQNMAVADKVKQEFFSHLNIPIEKMDAHSIKALQSLGEALGQEGVQVTQDDGAEAVMTPAEATQILNEIMANSEHAYWNPRHPGHKDAVQRVIKLHEFKSGKRG